MQKLGNQLNVLVKHWFHLLFLFVKAILKFFFQDWLEFCKRLFHVHVLALFISGLFCCLLLLLQEPLKLVYRWIQELFHRLLRLVVHKQMVCKRVLCVVSVWFFVLVGDKFWLRLFLPLITRPRRTVLIVFLHRINAHQIIHHVFVLFFDKWLLIKLGVLSWGLPCQDVLLVVFAIIFLKIFEVGGSWRWFGVVLGMGKFLVLRGIGRLVEDVAIDDEAVIGDWYWGLIEVGIKRGIVFGFSIEMGHEL